jgi:hypothetical protein
VLVIKTQDLFVRGQTEQMENTSETGTKLGLLDKIKAKVGMGDAGDGVPDSTGVGHHHTTEPSTAAAAGAGGGARHRSESSPYDSAGAAPTSGTTNPPGSSGITDAANSSAPSATSTEAHGQRSESSPYDSSGAAPSAAESVTTTSHPGSAHEPTTTADSNGQEHVRTESSPYDTAGANPAYLTKNQAGAAAGATTFRDSQGNFQEGPRDDNVKKEGLVSKIMDKLHHSSTTTP